MMARAAKEVVGRATTADTTDIVGGVLAVSDWSGRVCTWAVKLPAVTKKSKPAAAAASASPSRGRRCDCC